MVEGVGNAVAIAIGVGPNVLDDGGAAGGRIAETESGITVAGTSGCTSSGWTKRAEPSVTLTYAGAFTISAVEWEVYHLNYDLEDETQAPVAKGFTVVKSSSACCSA